MGQVNIVDYNQLLNVKKTNLEWLDEHTLLDTTSIQSIRKDEYNEDIDINIEVWTDENNAIKISELYSDGDIESLTDKLPINIYEHLEQLILKDVKNKIKERKLKKDFA